MLKIGLIVLLGFITKVSQDVLADSKSDGKTGQPEKASPGSAISRVINAESSEREDLYVNHNRGCFCTYDYENSSLKAKIGQRILKRGDRVMRGQTVSLECSPDTKLLMWQNGFRYFRIANMTCNRCEIWQRKDLPNCIYFRSNDTLITSNEDFIILPGGIVDLLKGKSRTFFCINMYVKPAWIHGERGEVATVSSQVPLIDGSVMYVETLDVSNLSNNHGGRYECCNRNEFGRCFGSSILDLKVNASCTGEPPAVKNGEAVVKSREHGFMIWYSCKLRNCVRLHGNITCHFGQWIGNPPKLLNNPCYTKDLQERKQSYPGLIIPPQEYFETEEGFETECEHGFRKATTVGKINCVSGKWDISQNPCIEDREEHTTISTILPGMTSAEECFCTYAYETPFVKAQIGHKKLKRGDKVMRGETVSFECKFPSRVLLSWQNGFRFFGRANMTCNVCKKWLSKHLPTCDYTATAGAVIGYEDDLKILPGGIVDMRKGENSQFFCSSSWRQPQWDYGEKKDVSVNLTQVSLQGSIIFVSLLNITGTQEEHNGRYECYMQGDHSQRTGSSFLDLQVVDFVSCSRFPDSLGLKVTYSKNVFVGSIATFSCSTSKSLIGSSSSVCRENASWSNPAPSCEESSRCSVRDLSMFVPEDVVPDVASVGEEFLPSGSVVELKCSGNSIMDGNSTAMCGENGKWEFGIFECVTGCILNIDRSSHLLVQPIKDRYSLGEILTLSCPQGENLSSDVDTVMCMGSRWSDSIPECEE